MNAPFRPQAVTREPFAAYVCDDDTLEVLRPVVHDMGWQIEKCHKGGLRNAVQSLSVTASPSVLLVDLSESSDPINDINGLAEVCEPGTVVIAMGQVNDVRLFRDLTASGIQDYLLKPVFPDQLRDVFLHAQAALAAPRNEAASANVTHLLTVVVGTRGGVGASSVATSLAWQMSSATKRNSALIDFDVHFGTGALSLDLEPGRGLIDAIDNPSRIDGLFIERAMVRANERLAILSAEAPVNQPLMSDGAALFHLREEIKHAFESTVVDLPRQMMVSYPHLLSDANAVVLVTELTLSGARDAIRLLAAFKAGCPSARVIVVANRVQAQPGELTRRDFENSIERPIDVLIPFEPKLAVKAAKLGKSIVEVASGNKLAQPFASLLQMVLATGDEGADVAAGVQKPNAKSGSLLGKLGEVGTLLSKKKAKG